MTVRFVIENEVDIALPEQGYGLGTMLRHRLEPSRSNRAAIAAGSDVLYSTNSKPSVPSGLSQRSPVPLVPFISVVSVTNFTPVS